MSLTVTTGQMVYEWKHLLAKLKARNPALYQKWRNTEVPEAHPMLIVRTGDVESWERSRKKSGGKRGKSLTSMQKNTLLDIAGTG